MIPVLKEELDHAISVELPVGEGKRETPISTAMILSRNVLN